MFGKFQPVPPVFWSFETDSPFEKCLICGCDLSDDRQMYFIEKAYQKGEVVFEYAMCMDCRESMESELSQESLQRVSKFFDERVDLAARSRELMDLSGMMSDRWLGKCLINGMDVDACDEYQIYAHCQGRHLVYSGFPYMISGDAVDEILELISDETLGFLDDFVERHLGPGVDSKFLLV